MISEEAFPRSRWPSLCWALAGGRYGVGRALVTCNQGSRCCVMPSKRRQASCHRSWPRPSLGLLMGPCKVPRIQKAKRTAAGSRCRQGETGFAKSNRHQHLVPELSATPQHLAEGGKAKAGWHPATRHCWVLPEQRARTVIIVSLSNFSRLYGEGTNTHQLSSGEKPRALLFAAKVNPRSPLPMGFSGIRLGKGQITSSRSRVIWGRSPLPFYYWIMDYYLLLLWIITGEVAAKI